MIYIIGRLNPALIARLLTHPQPSHNFKISVCLTSASIIRIEYIFLLDFSRLFLVRILYKLAVGNQFWSVASSFRGIHFLFSRDHFLFSTD